MELLIVQVLNDSITVPLWKSIRLSILAVLNFTTLWANSADDKQIFCSFSQKTAFDILCKLSPMKTICMKCQNQFSGRNKKKYLNMSAAKFYPKC